MSSYVSALSSCGQRSFNDLGTKYSLPSAWVAAGYSSGHCRLLDYRSGRVVMNWRAHDAAVTKARSVQPLLMSIMMGLWKSFLAGWWL
jgi:WD repeat-containing protein 81